MPGHLYAGTSGFAYKEWKPGFYPADLPQKHFLRYYAEHVPSVEINNTFYRTPTETLLTGWTEQSPPEFRFTLKAPQRITHYRRLREVDEDLGYFLTAARALGERLGAILFQCPPTLRYDEQLLKDFLAVLPGEPFRFAMEFRHSSWDTGEARAHLHANNVAWCVAETGDDLPYVQTAQGFAYLRLRRDGYTQADVERWARAVGPALDAGSDVYAYFKHEDSTEGVRAAQRLIELVS
ncbi:MAG TPA: DUF72 domain-containing protein [Actinomycetota bacterium]